MNHVEIAAIIERASNTTKLNGDRISVTIGTDMAANLEARMQTPLAVEISKVGYQSTILR